MFKPFPDVVVTPGCGNSADANYSINWEEIARWALEHGGQADTGSQAMPPNASPGGAIDWCRVADSFMRDEAADNPINVCDANEVNTSVRAHDHPNLFADLHYPSESVSRLAADGYGEFPSPIQYRERMRTPAPQCRRRQREAPKQYSWMGNPEFERSMRDSDFNNTSCYDRTPLSPMRDFSCMDADYMHDSTQDYQSDIMSYLEGRAERNRPHSMAEGYHFPGRAYEAADNADRKMFTSTPKKTQRTTRAETFEMPDGSKMFNVTFEECLDFGRRIRHISDVRDSNGCQIMHMDREVDEEANGPKHRIDIARRWLNFDEDDEGGGAGCR